MSACLTVSHVKFGPVTVKFDMSVSCTKAELCMCEGYLGLHYLRCKMTAVYFEMVDAVVGYFQFHEQTCNVGLMKSVTLWERDILSINY